MVSNKTLRHTVGLLVALALTAMAAVSMLDDYAMDMHVAATILILIFFLLYGADHMVELVDRWKGGGGGNQ